MKKASFILGLVFFSFCETSARAEINPPPARPRPEVVRSQFCGKPKGQEFSVCVGISFIRSSKEPKYWLILLNGQIPTQLVPATVENSENSFISLSGKMTEIKYTAIFEYVMVARTYRIRFPSINPFEVKAVSIPAVLEFEDSSFQVVAQEFDMLEKTTLP
jgi:hypothetical protein